MIHVSLIVIMSKYFSMPQGFLSSAQEGRQNFYYENMRLYRIRIVFYFYQLFYCYAFHSDVETMAGSWKLPARLADFPIVKHKKFEI